MSEKSQLRVRVFADGANLEDMVTASKNPLIAGFTTNPTLMRQSGVTDYVAFAHEVLAAIQTKPISFEVFSDNLEEMERQAHTIAAWADNVYVKIPITNTKGETTAKLVERLSSDGIKVNVTAILSLAQVRTAAEALESSREGIVSVFAGRVADTGRDPVPLMTAALALLEDYPQLQLLWASPREVLNVIQADRIGCHIITVTNDLLKKIDGLGRDLEAFSLDTVKMFHGDARKAGFSL
ncbi:MAG: transaldolase [Acidimicrobiaceae bacterium]|nr:transaldolase [Acidimicrobiaceae bacterium]